MTYRTDDPIKDFERWDYEQNKALLQQPVCADCDEPIQDDHFYLINDEAICPCCIEAYRRSVDDYID